MRNAHLSSDMQAILAGCLRIADVIGVGLAGVVAYLIREGHADMGVTYLVALAIGMLLILNFMQFAKLYTVQSLRSGSALLGRLIGAWIAVLVVVLAFGFFSKTSEGISRIWFLLWALSGLSFLLFNRVVASRILAHWNRQGRLRARVAIVGAGGLGERLVEHLREHGGNAMSVVGVWDDRLSRVPEKIGGFDVRGTIDDLIAYTRNNPVDDIIVALPWSAGPRIRQMARKLYVVPANVRVCPDLVGFGIPLRGFSSLQGVPLLNVYERPLGGWGVILKAIEDKVGAALMLALFAPLMLLVALAVKLDSPGPVLFRQKRYGFNNNEFSVFKFRTMYQRTVKDEDGVPQATKGDARITRVGAFLRKTSLDELPQLFNVLRGEMSIVGPRPHAVAHNEKYGRIIDEYMCRHRVKPGITGWAQVNGWRGETETPEKMSMRVQYDLYYIENWSLLLDVRILFMTAFVGFAHRNAY